MESELELLRKSPIGSFSTIILHDQYYGEVPPHFIDRFRHQLQPQWHLWDENHVRHNVSFAINHCVPHLTCGWFAIVMHFGITKPTEINFLYYGDKTFTISIKQINYNNAHYPSFHSLSTKPTFTTYFELKLSKYTSTSSQLTLQKDFADYLRTKAFPNVILCTENLYVVTCSLLIRGHPKNSVKIGSGWKHLCQVAQYQAGDTLRFKIPGRVPANLIQVICI
ncbi:DNA helicase [Trifolium repens]|nr:DNA helicase [Trifolium repens]